MEQTGLLARRRAAHIVLVPLFLAGNVAMVVGLICAAFLQQWGIFPRFALTGGRSRAMRESRE